MPSDRKVDLLFVAHVPPPWTGQGVVNLSLLQGEYSDVRLVHLPMLFSKQSTDQGKLSVGKFVVLFRLILSTFKRRFVDGVRHLYFSPGGPSLSAIVRDGLYLLMVRPFMSKTMFVYHSSGVADYIERTPGLIRPVVRHAFAGVELAIQLSENTPPDGVALGAEETRVIPNAVPDGAGPWFARVPKQHLKILYMGLVTEGKGVGDLLLAAQDLSARGIDCEVQIVGAFRSDDEERELRGLAERLPAGAVTFSGALAGEAKHEAFRSSDVFCFPSFWHTETFPLVLLEALSYGLPIVATYWRGIPDLIGTDGSCGTLVNVHATAQIATVLEELALNPTLRQSQSKAARSRYERYFCMEPFFAAYDAAFSSLVRSA